MENRCHERDDVSVAGGTRPPDRDSPVQDLTPCSTGFLAEIITSRLSTFFRELHRLLLQGMNETK